MDKIILLDQENNEVEFELIDTFGVDEANYAALKQVNEDLILILEIIEDGKELVFKSIDDDKKLDEIVDFYEQMKEESDEY
ncbi:MAG: DUF1292 domain-containing protein [Anaerococcus sp.]|nr:DUF1292 domain-containing protein [Anaerococcus sp.]